jgi:hydrogenase/urease accessory protein HupE
MKRTLLLLVFLHALAPSVRAHEVRPAYLELRQTSPDTYDVLWKVPGLNNQMRLGIYVELPEGSTNLSVPSGSFVNGGFIERWKVHRAGGLSGSTIHIAGLSVTATDVLVRVGRLDGTTQVTRLTPANPSFLVEASPDNLQVVRTYLVLGVEHIWLGVDHLLFVFGLLLLVKSRWMLLKTVTAFTVAHSITLALATLGYAHLPVPPLNAAIALSILILGVEIVRSWSGVTSITILHPWIVAFAFGLLHGFGFASGLSALGLPDADIPLALVMFNVGVEIGQVSFVLSILLLERSFRQLEIRWPRWAQALPGYTVGSLGAFWTIQRVAMLLGIIP